MKTHYENLKLLWLKCKNARTLKKCSSNQEKVKAMKILRNK